MKRMILFVIVFMATIMLSACSFNKQKKSGLQVITDGTQASVYLNDTYVEKTPFIDKELNPGEYSIKVQPDDPNLIPYEKTINLRPGLLTVVTWKLAERPEFSGGVIYEMEPISSKNKSEISFVTIPDGAIVSVGENEKTFSPTIMTDVVPGHNEFEVSLPSYESQKHTINAVAGYRMLVTVKLAKINLSVQKEETKIPEDEKTTESTNSAQTLIDEEKTTTSSAQPKTKLGAAQVKIKSTNFFNEGKEVLRVRDFPGSSGKELGFAEVEKSYTYLGSTQNNWYNISFNDDSGWVSGDYAELVQ